MAIILTTIAMTPTYLPYERLPDPAMLWSSVPRGLRGGVVEFGALDAKPLNDDSILQLTLTLPANFAYVFAEIGLRVSVDVALAWETEYTLNLQNWYQGHPTVSISYSFDFPTIGLMRDERGQGHTALDTTPKAPMWAPKGTSGIQCVISTFNGADAVGAVGNLAAYLNFWEFDLEQVRKYPINTPIPTHSR